MVVPKEGRAVVLVQLHEGHPGITPTTWLACTSGGKIYQLMLRTLYKGVRNVSSSNHPLLLAPFNPGSNLQGPGCDYI